MTTNQKAAAQAMLLAGNGLSIMFKAHKTRSLNCEDGEDRFCDCCENAVKLLDDSLAAYEATAKEPEAQNRSEEPRIYKCDNCSTMRTKSEGGDVFTLCEECWDKHFKPQPAPACPPRPTEKTVEELDWEKALDFYGRGFPLVATFEEAIRYGRADGVRRFARELQKAVNLFGSFTENQNAMLRKLDEAAK